MKGLKIEEVAMRIGVSSQTLNRWYKFKRENPKDEVSKRLPAYKLVTNKSGKVRLWQTEDLQKLMEFKAQMVSGRDGKMGKYKGKGTKNGEKKIRTAR